MWLQALNETLVRCTGMGGRGMMGPPGPPMGGRGGGGGRGMAGIDSAKWQRGLQPPPPPPGMQGGGFGGPPRGYGGAAAMLHKTENRYKVWLCPHPYCVRACTIVPRRLVCKCEILHWTISPD